MKKLLKWTLIGFLGLMVLGAIGNATTPTPARTAAPQATAPTSNPEPQPTAVPQPQATAVPVVQVSMATLAAQYDGNKLRAQAYYKDRVIQVRGTAGDVNQDLLGSYYVSVQPGGDYYGMTQVQCLVADPRQLVALTNGHAVTVRGRVDDMSLGIIPLKDCQVVR